MGQVDKNALKINAGNIDMNTTNKIINLKTPENDYDAVNKKYADNIVSTGLTKFCDIYDTYNAGVSGGTGNNNNSWWTQSVDAYSASCGTVSGSSHALWTNTSYIRSPEYQKDNCRKITISSNIKVWMKIASLVIIQ